jgi:hypothetical protein
MSSHSKKRSYIIHSGWWCDATRIHPGSLRNDSDGRIRSPGFFDVWYDCIKRFSIPEKIILLDSNSPIQPKVPHGVEFVSLRRNFLHAENCDSSLTGWTRAFLIGAFYALMNDVDYSVYVEQDCVLVGAGIIEQAIASMEDNNKRISYGELHNLGNLIEQSFVIIRKDYILDFIRRYLSISETDNIFSGISPERKFTKINEEDGEWAPLPFGFGRNRPINFHDAVFYCQQLSAKELAELYECTGFDSLNRLLSKEIPCSK